VYSFGVILVEVLTHKKQSSYVSPEGFNLVSEFSSSVSEDKLWEILDPQVIEEAEEEESREVAAIAMMCYNSKGVDRPLMRQVEMRLQVLQNSANDTRRNQSTKSNSNPPPKQTPNLTWSKKPTPAHLLFGPPFSMSSQIII